MLERPTGDCVVFLEEHRESGLRAFAEVALRRDFVNGCDSSPVAFLEGIFVRPEDRKRGIAARLLRSARSWAQDRGCCEFASDALLENTGSHAFHRATGFEETERVVFFRLRL